MTKAKEKTAEQKKQEQQRVDAMISAAALTDYKPSPERQAQIDAEKSNRKRKP